MNIQQLLSGAGSTKNLVSYIQTEIVKELKEEYKQYISENETKLLKVLELIYAKKEGHRRNFIGVD